MKDLEREVELLREKVRLLERLRELEGGNIPAPIYPIPLYVPPYPLYPYTPWTDGAHTGKWIPDPTITICDGDNLTNAPCSFTDTKGPITYIDADVVGMNDYRGPICIYSGVQ